MPKSVYITAPRPTFEEMTKHLHISKARKKELQALADEFRAQLSNPESVTAAKPEKRRKRASAA